MSDTSDLTIECFDRYFDESTKELSGFLIADDYEREEFVKFFSLDVVDDSIDVTLRDLVPTIRYDGRSRGMSLRVSPNTQIEFAKELPKEEDEFDVPRILTGAGVARGILAWRILPHKLKAFVNNESLSNAISDLGSFFSIAREAEAFDSKYGVDLTSSLLRIDEAEIEKINVIRLAVGIALTHLSGVLDLQQRWPATMQDRLNDHLTQREAYYTQIQRLFGADDSQRLYDDSLSYNLLGVSFPMLPDEEVEIFHNLKK